MSSRDRAAQTGAAGRAPTPARIGAAGRVATAAHADPTRAGSRESVFMSV